jgi:Fic family protein
MWVATVVLLIAVGAVLLIEVGAMIGAAIWTTEGGAMSAATMVVIWAAAIGAILAAWGCVSWAGLRASKRVGARMSGATEAATRPATSDPMDAARWPAMVAATWAATEDATEAATQDATWAATEAGLNAQEKALIESVERKKALLDGMRPLSAAVLARLQKHYDIELTDKSNATEGNALTLNETALLIEHGMVVFGSSFWDALTFMDDYEAVQWMRELATLTAPIGESTVCELNRRIGTHYLPANTGIYRQLPQRIRGSRVLFPDCAKIPQLMEEFGAWLKAAPSDPAFAFEAHFRLTAIHPFDDGNGRTARLLMNLLLIRGGYPPVAVRPEDRKTYVYALKRGSLIEDWRPFQIFMHEPLDATLEEYLRVL